MINHTIGFIGLGNMGKPIFDNISKSLKHLHCFDQKDFKGSQLYKFTDINKIFKVCDVIIFCIKTNKEKTCRAHSRNGSQEYTQYTTQ